MLVTLEGLDGSGKTTVWERLRADDALPPDATFTREPTDSWYGEAVQRSIDDGDADSVAELFLYTADHAAHLAETVRPGLEDGGLVVSDRYSDSRYAYQGATLAETDWFEDPLDYVREVHAPWTRPPDLTLFLDLDPETAARRSGVTNKFETADYLANVRENYDRLREDDPERFVAVDATADPDAVYDRVRAAIVERL
ncbi:dTMP kinase [Halomicroarcula limicola]|uniref:Probable thymidylate kinase n=1 Tax=Haloarcula limicola TaxID=1429915 RepID=A0A8J7Y6F3_9EURY|nr:dTMP kinase [Halomicroarcula limicola]MBV0924907.1 dTMP kinase [Halomicroarcula limicola]